ncbi:hypothetical protein ABFY58_03935 [Enterobacter soli]
MSSPIMKYFAYQHLPAHLQEVSKPIGDLATLMDESLPDGAEKSAGPPQTARSQRCTGARQVGLSHYKAHLLVGLIMVIPSKG